MAKQDTITADYIRSILIYNPETGVFVWRRRDDVLERWNTKHAGKVSGATRAVYGIIKINNVGFRAHRLAWLYVTGRWPAGDIDHIDMNRMNNAIANLRIATPSQNKANMNKRADNMSGFKGVSKNKRGQKWRAQIKINGKATFLGNRNTPEEAHELYRQAAEAHFREFARS